MESPFIYLTFTVNADVTTCHLGLDKKIQNKINHLLDTGVKSHV